MPGRERVPSFQLPSGTTAERDGSYNLTTVGNIFYNTDTSNVEIRHEDPSNSLDWRDLIVNNKDRIDLSGNLKLNSPRFYAYSNKADESLSGNTPWQFNLTAINVNSCYNTTGYYFEAPIDGDYRFSFTMFPWSGSSRQAQPQKYNPSTSSWEDVYTSGGSGQQGSAPPAGTNDLISSFSGGNMGSVTFILRLNSGERIRLYPRDGTTQVFYLKHSFFWGELISAI